MTDIKSKVDELGLLYAEKARLAEREKALKAELQPAMLAKPVTLVGNLFEVTVSYTAGRDTLSMAKAKLYLLPALLEKITSHGASSIRWGVKARSAEKVAA